MNVKKHPSRKMPKMQEGSPGEEATESASVERKEKAAGID